MNTSARAMWGLAALLLIIIGVLAYFLFTGPITEPGVPNTNDQNGLATSTDEGNDGGNGAMSTTTLASRVVVYQSASDTPIEGTFTMNGEAPGPWYFEASFPVEVRDANDNLLTTAVAQAQSDWMTTEQVPFAVEITIEDYTGPATLVLKRDNASGLPEHDASVEVPITIE